MGQLLQSGAKCYFKEGQVYRSGRVISNWSITLQSYDLAKSKTQLTFEKNYIMRDDRETLLIPQDIFKQLDLVIY